VLVFEGEDGGNSEFFFGKELESILSSR